MLDDDDDGVSGQLWGMIADNIGFMAPVLVIDRPESLTVLDYRPNLMMLLSAAGFLVFAGLFGWSLMTLGLDVPIALWATGIPAVICLVLTFRGTIREVYIFDRTTDSYALIRQFLYKKDVVEGTLSQFTGAYVKTVTDPEAGSAYYVVLKQEGMFLTGVEEQTLREQPPVLSSFSTESRIANAISNFLSKKPRIEGASGVS